MNIQRTSFFFRLRASRGWLFPSRRGPRSPNCDEAITEMHDSCVFLCILSVAVIIFKDQRRRRTMNTWTRKLTSKQKLRKWAKDRGIFSVVIPVEGRGGGGVRVLRKVTRIVIEGFLGEFQIFHCRIFGGKKIWKVPFLGGGRGGERCCEI